MPLVMKGAAAQLHLAYPRPPLTIGGRAQPGESALRNIPGQPDALEPPRVWRPPICASPGRLPLGRPSANRRAARYCRGRILRRLPIWVLSSSTE